MPFTDKLIVCADCQAEFTHSAADQQRYSELGFTSEPKRCPTCRQRRKAGGGGGGGGRAGRSAESFPATCAECGKETTVPFRPTEGRAVYCQDCYRSRRR